MSGEEIQKAVTAICKKAGHIVGHLTDPSAYNHLVYEMARFHLSHLVGEGALHGDTSFSDNSILEQALIQLDKEIQKASQEAQRRHA